MPAFLTKRITRDGKVIKFEIWDTAGQERFAPLAPMYYRNAQAALVVFDVTNEGSFYKAQNWVEELHEKVGHDIVIALVGNKMDLLNNDDENENRAMEHQLYKISVTERTSYISKQALRLVRIFTRYFKH